MAFPSLERQLKSAIDKADELAFKKVLFNLERVYLKHLSRFNPEKLESLNSLVGRADAWLFREEKENANPFEKYSMAWGELKTVANFLIGANNIKEKEKVLIAGLGSEILNLLYEKGTLQPTEIAKELDKKTNHISNILRTLDMANLVRRQKAGKYCFCELTPKGTSIVKAKNILEKSETTKNISFKQNRHFKEKLTQKEKIQKEYVLNG